ncbi:amino acid adenylation domain-containing protein [Actinacidiphila yanglinensis]|uniref:Amino acid adenylation domain-containing protein n=1 Tax=Actinacidiphila yanglinensis TaxID=310779 RepID=A0A1H6DIJ4_9ACTN|nr:non-ribosomal peptide synthetase [Actinacidiphila yanglinensis]SEG84505.1 amino acid adenylation domain-containing protein [Actinacidiphila yanglinensis]
MPERADPVLPVLWTDGPATTATGVPVHPAAVGAGAFAAAVHALATRYCGEPPTRLLVRSPATGTWTAASAGDPCPNPTMGTLRAGLSRSVGDRPAPVAGSDGTPDAVSEDVVDVALGEYVTLRFTPHADSTWTVTANCAATPADPGAPARIADHVAAYLLAPDNTLIGSVDHRTDAERELLADVNRTRVPLPETACLHEHIEAVARAMPDRAAVEQGTDVLSYGRLDRLADALAARITACGVGPGGRVGVAVSRSVELVIAAYAVLKAGAAYVPLDPLLPGTRQETLRRIGRVDLVIAAGGRPVAGQHRTPVIVLDSPADLRPAPHGPRPPVHGSDLAYVIFTSGSAGSPKAAMLDHAGRTAMLTDLSARIALGPGDRVLAVSSPSFDISILDLFSTLMAGATVVLPDLGRENDVRHWTDLVAERGITVWESVPSLLSQFLTAWRPDRGGVVRAVLVGGDWIPMDLPDAVRRVFPDARIIGIGGATEASVASVTYRIEHVDPAWRSIPYGRPMANQTAYVLDAFDRPAGIDQPGDQVLGGVAVGWGYLGDPALTAEKFRPDPFSEEPGARLYRTGDLVRMRGDGEVEILGRIDHQVKVGGVRVELGEIESCLREHSALREAVVVPVRDEAGRVQALAAYVVCAPGVADDGEVARSARAYLAQRLPSSMVPARIEVLPELPVTGNRKIARRELETRAAQARPAAAPAPAPAGHEVLTALSEIWSEVLGLSEPPTAERTFVGLGGGSLAAMQVVNRLNQRFGTDLSAADLLGADTMAHLALIVSDRIGRRRRPPLVRRR